MKKNKSKVSVVIPCRNEENYIGQCLDYICRQTYGIEHIEVMVCDGMSEDKSRMIVSEYSKKYPSIKLVDNIKKVAPVAMNLGIKESTGDIVIIFGAHAYMDECYVENCVKKLDETDAMCVGGRIESISENESAEVISKAMSSPFGVGNALFRYSEEETYVDTVAFGAYKREVFEEIGLFDEELVRNQDDEINYRVTKSGMKILLTPIVKSYYYTRGSFAKLWRQYFQYGFWKVRVIQKHNKPAALRHLVPILFVLSLIIGIVLSPFSSIIRNAFVFEIIVYLLCAGIFSLKVCEDKVQQIPRIMISFFILHTSYGLGFLEGIFKFYIRKTNKGIEKYTKTSR
ncbi:glycosyltransferase family 2 protein [Oceanirhabdus sp. W0125-5]|nr:glycosyltransferase family 2 protein [Oceanirhabdus sp. W0125-5]WBW99449.1 glycosyltransferase family 2 protein [Oceanirhabdus sp. W0125-5]